MIHLKVSAAVCVLLFSLSVHLEAQELEPTSPTPPSRVYYSVFVRSFCDSNGDGIGDIKGLTSKLDYLKDLGIQGLWLLPVHPSPTYHKNDVSDYYSIDPEYGTLDDYKALLIEAHKRNMVVLLDLVINHTSNQINWFREATQSPKNKYRNFYIWSENPLDFKTEAFQWHAIRDKSGKALSGPKYHGSLWWTMPDLNFDNPKVRQEVFSIASFWLQKVGVDGFRLDAAKYVYPENQTDKNIQWWSTFCQEARKMNKEVILMGDIQGSAKEIAPYLNDCMTACFNYQLADSIRISLQQEIDHYILQTWWQIHDRYNKENSAFEDAIFLSNHNSNRVMTEIGNKTSKAKVAASLLLTLPGNPFIYYGEEIGMLGEKPDEFIREPFLWDIEGTDPGQTHWEIPYSSSSQTVKPLKFQQDDPESLYRYYQELISIRNASAAISIGSFQPLIQSNRKIIAFYRSFDHEKVLVLINLSKDIQQISSPAQINEYKQLTGTHKVFKSGNGVVYLQPYASFILRKTN